MRYAPILAALFGLLITVGACVGQERPAATSANGWEVASPASVGLDPQRLAALRADAASGAFQNLHSILIVRYGRLVFEEYFDDFEAETLQYTASVSKSVGSILLGIAMDRGLVPGLEDSVLDATLVDLLPEYGILADDRKSLIRLRHALSMTGGLEWDETSLPYSDSNNDWIRASRSEDPLGFALARPVVAQAGVEFNYHGVYSLLPSYLIERASGASAEAFASEHLFALLGISEWEWDTIANGLTDTDGGLHLRPRDMAKLGQLYLDGGMWAERRILSEAWIEESTSRQIDNRDSPDYCLLWWCGDFHYGDRSTFTFFASGHGGQMIHVFPTHDLVVVVTQQVFDNPFGELNVQAILSRYVLPAADSAARDDSPIELDAEALALFTGEYAGRGAPITVVLRDGALVAEAEGAPTMRLVPLEDGRFRGTVLDLLDVHFAFKPREIGRPDSVRVRWGFRSEIFRRVDP